MSIIRVTKKYASILSSHQKLRIFELAVLMVIGGLLETCSVSLVLPFMNAVLEPEATMGKWYARLICGLLRISEPRDFLIVLAIILAVIYILKNLYLLFEFNIQYQFVYGNMLDMQQRLLGIYLHRPYEFFLQASSGEIIRSINGDVTGAFNLLVTLLNLLTELVVSAMLVAAVFVITPVTMLCMAAIMLLLLLIINRFIKPVLQKAGLSYRESAAGMYKWLLQSVQGIKELKIMGKEDFFQKNFGAFGSRFITSMRKNQLLSTVPRFLIEAVSMGTMFVVVAALIYQGAELETIIPMLTAVAMAAIRLLPSMNRISNGLAAIAYNESMLDKLIEILKDVEGSDPAHSEPARESESTPMVGTGIAPIQKDIQLDRIVYHYPDAESNVLTDASMTIQRGESIGVIGASGAGKTTAIDIMLGLLRPQSGKVLADGADIAEDIHGWHAQIGYIPQLIFMLDDTIRNNVCFGEDEKTISDDKVWQALEEASLADFVRSLPKGLDTEIGERGVRLSGGQRQRIGIARALYRDPDVLVFDEATSALDNETEAEIMESIQHLQGNKTMIIIAHRLTTIENCDHVYRVENGLIQQER